MKEGKEKGNKRNDGRGITLDRDRPLKFERERNERNQEGVH